MGTSASSNGPGSGVLLDPLGWMILTKAPQICPE